MMLRVVYMAHMCLPQRVWLGLRLRFRVAAGMEVLRRYLIGLVLFRGVLPYAYIIIP